MMFARAVGCCCFLVGSQAADALVRGVVVHHHHGPPNGVGCASHSRRAFVGAAVATAFTIPPANGDEPIRYKSKTDGDQDPFDVFAESLSVNKAPPSKKTGNAKQTNDLSFGDIALPSSSEEKPDQAGGLEQALREKKSRRTIDPRTHG